MGAGSGGGGGIIIPNVGDTVLYNDGTTTSPALITKVHSKTCVNVKVLPDNSAPRDATSQNFVDEGGTLSWPTWRVKLEEVFHEVLRD